MKTPQQNPDIKIDHRPIPLTPKPSMQGGSTSLFPRKLHLMLQKCTSDGNDGIVSWLSDGRAFKVHNVPEFVSVILPKYFKQTKYKSFQRQLNLWRFERILTGADKGAYHHPNFLQQRPSLCSRLKRRGHKKVQPTEPTRMTMPGKAVSLPSQVSPTQRPQILGLAVNDTHISSRIFPIQRPGLTETTNSDAYARSKLLELIMKKAKKSALVPSQALPIQRPQMIETTGNNNFIPNDMLPIESPRNPIPRNVSEPSFPDPFENLCFKIDPNLKDDESNLADFEGGTFYPLDDDQYEELNDEFGVSRQPEKQVSTLQPEKQQVFDNSHQNALLEQLERGYLGVLNSELMT
mmetsp:Transcript_5391/g.13544  ORF Transcript_5391/g.13544 Transcript_5391/m.13544 type:complete len:349 (-) Transcript_5391:110-1156(-)